MAKGKAAGKRNTRFSLEGRMGRSSSPYSSGTEYHSRYSSSSTPSLRKASHPFSSRRGGKSLEQRVGGVSLHAAAKRLMERGYSSRQAYAIAYAHLERTEARHDWVSLDHWVDRVNSHKDKSLGGAIKGAWYLALALTDVSPATDPYKQIKEGASVLYFPGFLSIPGADAVKKFEAHLGRKIAYVPFTDPHKVHEVISAAYAQHGRVTAIGFSDGGKVLDVYLGIHGDDKLDRIFAVATNPLHSHSSRIHHIVGDRDMLAAGEKQYTGKGHIVYGGHTFFFSDQRTMNETAAVINSFGPSRTYFTPGYLVTTAQIEGKSLLPPSNNSHHFLN